LREAYQKKDLGEDEPKAPPPQAGLGRDKSAIAVGKGAASSEKGEKRGKGGGQEKRNFDHRDWSRHRFLKVVMKKDASAIFGGRGVVGRKSHGKRAAGRGGFSCRNHRGLSSRRLRDLQKERGSERDRKRGGGGVHPEVETGLSLATYSSIGSSPEQDKGGLPPAPKKIMGSSRSAAGLHNLVRKEGGGGARLARKYGKGSSSSPLSATRALWKPNVAKKKDVEGGEKEFGERTNGAC